MDNKPTDKGEWVKFLLEDYERPIPPDGDGLICVATGISELESCDYRNQSKLMECLYLTICNLFQIDDLELQTTQYYNSFLLINKHETDFNSQEGYESPQLSRKKLISGSAKEISDAIIALIRNRKNWKTKRMYNTLHLD